MFKNRLIHCFAVPYNWLIKLGGGFQSLFLFWMRLTWGHQFFLAGLNKLMNADQMAQMFTNLHFKHPDFQAHFVGWVEVIGGICLIAGLASRLVAVFLGVIMVTALSTAHASTLGHFRFITEPASLVQESPYPFLITCLLVLFFGPGRISLDGWIKRWANKQPRY